MALVELLAVKKVYRTTVALDIERFAIEQGDGILLLGSNGSGKSTLLRVLAGFTTASAGSIRRARQLADMRVGYVPQSGGVYDDMTFRENLALYRRLYGLSSSRSDPGPDFVREAGLEPFLDVLVAELSGGLRHAAALACVLAVAPQALLLDEPVSDLDSTRKEALWSVLTALSPSLAFVVMASHGSDAPAFVGRRITLVNGRMS